MAAEPPRDWSKVPGANRAYDLSPKPGPEAATAPKKSTRAKSIVAKPLVWLLSLLLAAIGGFVINYVTRTLENAAITTSDPFFIYDVHQIEAPDRDMAGYVVPGDWADLETVEWGSYGSAESGGVPTTEWVFEHGGTAAGWGAWEVVLESKRDTAITIVDVQAENVTCAAPESGGTHFIFKMEGELPPTRLAVHIDAAAPQFKTLPEDWPVLVDTGPEQALASFAAYGDGDLISLAPGEQHTVQFFATATTQSCTWDVAIEYAADNTYGTAVLEDSGDAAFALAALQPSEAYDTVVLPYIWCSDGQGHAVTGEVAARIIAERDDGGPDPDCA